MGRVIPLRTCATEGQVSIMLDYLGSSIFGAPPISSSSPHHHLTSQSWRGGGGPLTSIRWPKRILPHTRRILSYAAHIFFPTLAKFFVFTRISLLRWRIFSPALHISLLCSPNFSSPLGFLLDSTRISLLCWRISLLCWRISLLC